MDSDEGDAESIIIDLRRHNGGTEIYTHFYKMLAEYLATEESKVDPRRHQSVSQWHGVFWWTQHFLKMPLGCT